MSVAQDRYFVLRADGSLAYYRAREEYELDLEARATLSMQRHELRYARDLRGKLVLVLLEKTRQPPGTDADDEAARGGSGTPSGGDGSVPRSEACLRPFRGVSPRAAEQSVLQTATAHEGEDETEGFDIAAVA